MVRNLNIFIWEVWGLPRCLVFPWGRDKWESGAPTTPVCTVLQAEGLGSLRYRNHFPSGALEGDLFSMWQSSNPLFSHLIFSPLSSIPLLPYLSRPYPEVCPSGFAFLSKHFPIPPHSLPVTFLTHSLNCPKAILDQKSQSEHFYFSPGHIPSPRQ